MTDTFMTSVDCLRRETHLVRAGLVAEAALAGPFAWIGLRVNDQGGGNEDLPRVDFNGSGCVLETPALGLREPDSLTVKASFSGSTSLVAISTPSPSTAE